MIPKIVTRLANIAAKMAGSDKYDPTVEPATAFEYYLDKAADKIRAIQSLPPMPPTGDYVLTGHNNFASWEQSKPVSMFTIVCDFPLENEVTSTPMTSEQIEQFNDMVLAFNEGRPIYAVYRPSETTDRFILTLAYSEGDKGDKFIIGTCITASNVPTPYYHFHIILDMRKEAGNYVIKTTHLTYTHFPIE